MKSYRVGIELGRWRRGFTITELVVAISIIGLIAAIAVPRLVGPSGFESRGFYDQAQQTVRFAHKTAVAWRRVIFVCVTANAVSAAPAAGCAAPLANPTTGSAVTVTAPDGVILSPVNFSFDSAGRPSPAGPLTITLTSVIAGDPPRQIVIERETGYAHP
ncbi:MAG: type II secretion system GspH family protein [Betaproteobacteria bacterium]|nr:type II secretion system GspH family protein [Betaproteobacteria bacterium]MDH3436801.1 type II secretion system GspH family protein [Betaproteobacteria bacterium]